MEVGKKIQDIGNKQNIQTIESKLYFYRLNIIWRLKSTLSISYINGKNYIYNELTSLDGYISNLKIPY